MGRRAGWRLSGGLILLLLTLWSLPASAQSESVSVSIPAVISFYVTDVGVVTTGVPSPSTFSFTNAHLAMGHSLRVSVRAGATHFTAPGGTTIPASYVSWLVSGAQGGVGTEGTLDPSAFTQLYVSDRDPISGHMDITWKLAPPPTGIRAGSHTLSITWKLESIGL
jgi:hypothetical protein